MTTEERSTLPLITRSTSGERDSTRAKAVQSNNASNDDGESRSEIKESLEDGMDQEGNEGDHGVIVTDPADLPEVKKKKKKSRKTGAQRGLGKPTGMEPFFADRPPTAEEYARDQERYNPWVVYKSEMQSMLTYLGNCRFSTIQQFEQTRKLTPERRDIFYKWLHYGGIIISPNIGIGGLARSSTDKDEVAQALSHALMSKELREDLESIDHVNSKYAVDFYGCMRGFLSRAVPTIYEIVSKEKCLEITTTCMRFMEYLLQHDVCNEYRQDVLKTRDFCRSADVEIWACLEAQRWLPGEFNIACSTLFGGYYVEHHNPDASWDNATLDDSKVFVGFSQLEATEIFSFGVAGAASEEVFELYEQLNFSQDDKTGLEITRLIEGQGFEIIGISQPSTECTILYKTNSDKYRPVGRVIAKAWVDSDQPVEDLTPEERQRDGARSAENEEEEFVFFVESIVMQHLHVGQKVQATIRKLNCGIWFFDAVTKVLPSFELWLPNELIEDYKNPRWVENAYAPGAPDWVASSNKRGHDQ